MKELICSNSVKITETRHNILRTIISNEYNAKWDDIVSKRRFPNLVSARRCYYAILRNVFYYTLEAIGKEANQDHSTVIAALKAHERYICVYKSDRKAYNLVKSAMLKEETGEELSERIRVLKVEKMSLKMKIDELSLKMNRVQKELIINNK